MSATASVGRGSFLEVVAFVLVCLVLGDVLLQVVGAALNAEVIHKDGIVAVAFHRAVNNIEVGLLALFARFKQVQLDGEII